MSTFEEYVQAAESAESHDEAIKYTIMALLEAIQDLTARVEDLESYVRGVKYGN